MEMTPRERFWRDWLAEHILTPAVCKRLPEWRPGIVCHTLAVTLCETTPNALRGEHFHELVYGLVNKHLTHVVADLTVPRP